MIDRANLHVYQPGLLFIPFGMYGYQSQDDVVRPIASPLPRNVALVNADVRLIDHAKRAVRTDRGEHAYDFLISALGCRTAPEEVVGMAEAMGTGVHTFYTLEGALAMREALDRFSEGRLVIDICEMPINSPPTVRGVPRRLSFPAQGHPRPHRDFAGHAVHRGRSPSRTRMASCRRSPPPRGSRSWPISRSPPWMRRRSGRSARSTGGRWATICSARYRRTSARRSSTIRGWATAPAMRSPIRAP